MNTPTHPDTVLIVDFGSQVTQLIARRVREAGVYSEIVPFQSAGEAFHRINPKAVILSGSPHSTVDIGSPRAPQEVFDANIPVLGICYGEQTMCAQLGGKVEAGHHREFGRAFLDIQEECALFDGVWAKGTRHQVWMSHGDKVMEISGGLQGRRHFHGRALCGDRQRGQKILRRPVPPGSGAHAGWGEAS